MRSAVSDQPVTEISFTLTPDEAAEAIRRNRIAGKLPVQIAGSKTKAPSGEVRVGWIILPMGVIPGVKGSMILESHGTLEEAIAWTKDNQLPVGRVSTWWNDEECVDLGAYLK